MKRYVCCIALLVCASLACAQESRPKWLVGYKGVTEGRREYTVTHAANELAKYMSKVLGSEVKTAPWDKADAENLFLVTDAQHAPRDVAAELEGKAPDAFVIRYPYTVDGKKACLLVSHDYFVYDFPVYHFLTKYMDIHWVGPGELGEVVPENPDWRMPREIRVIEEPDFAMMRQLTVNGVMERRWLAGSARMGFNHAIPGIFHPNKYAKTDPEIYPLVGGKRYIPPAGKEHGNWMPCTSNPKTIEIAVKHVLDMVEKHPHTKCVSLSPPDGGGNVCMCAACRAQDCKDAFADPSTNPHLTDRYYRFYNAVAERVVEKNPDAYIGVFGYGLYVGRAPREVKLHPHIVVTKCGALRGITEGGWEKAGIKHLAQWKYLSQYAFIVLRNYPHMLADEIRWLHSLGGVGFYSSDPAYSAWASGVAINCYVVANLLWDTDRDVDELVDEYLRLAFGSHAAPAMREYFDRWEEIHQRLPKEEQTSGFLYYEHPLQLRNFRRDDMTALDAHIAEARSSDMTEKQRARFEMFATFYQWLWVSLEQHLLSKEIDSTQWLVTRAPEEALATVAEKMDLTDRMNAMWRDTISKDRTGWLLGRTYHKNPQQHWTQNQASLRLYIALSYETAAFNLMESITARSVLANGKEKTLAFWQAQVERHPRLENLIGSQINILKGEIPQNRLANAGFEEGKDGRPPKLPGWKTYREYGGIKDASFNYRWEEGTGFTAKKSFGILEGLYGGLQSDPVRLEPGCYRYSFWMKTINRTYSITCYSLFKEENGANGEAETAYQAEPTNGKWRKVTRIFTVPKAVEYRLQLDSFWQKKGWETYLDDIELVKLY